MEIPYTDVEFLLYYLLFEEICVGVQHMDVGLALGGGPEHEDLVPAETCYECDFSLQTQIWPLHQLACAI